MSIPAINWAWTARGLKPSARMVLLALANCHNPDHGCFPSQEYIARVTEISRDSVNDQLKTLEAKGLIRRVRSFDQKTKRARPTRYKLAFEDDFQISDDQASEARETCQAVSEIPTREDAEAVSEKPEKPCRKNPESRVGNSDSNLVIEPIKESGVASLDAARIDKAFARFWKAYPTPRNLCATSELFKAAVDQGADPETLAQAAERFRAENKGKLPRYLPASDTWLRAGKWKEILQDLPKDPEGDILRFWAAKINQGAFIPSRAITPRQARQMLASGLVTPDQLQRAGVAA